MEILDGYTKIQPVKSGTNIACNYCDFKGICQFDTRFENNNYKLMKKYKKNEVLELISNK